MPEEKPKEMMRQNVHDHYWTFFTNHKWIEHQEEVKAWEGHYPKYSQEEYIKKNKDFLIEEWGKVMWPGHAIVKPKPDKGK